MQDTGCDKLESLIEEQRKIIERHIETHAWYRHIPDKSRAVIDFVELYGWLMREAFCDLCEKEEGKSCEVYRQYLARNGKAA